MLIKVKVKVKFMPEQAMKAERGNRGIALLFHFPQSYMGVGGQRHTLAALPPGKTWYPFYRRQMGPRAGLEGC